MALLALNSRESPLFTDRCISDNLKSDYFRGEKIDFCKHYTQTRQNVRNAPKLLQLDYWVAPELFDVRLTIRRQVCVTVCVYQLSVYSCYLLIVAINYFARLKFNPVLRHFSVFFVIKIYRNSYSNLTETFKRVKVRLISLELSQSQ